MTKQEKADRAEAIARLREWVKPGDTIHVINRHTSRSGMLRVLQLVKLETNERGEVQKSWLGYNAALALGWSYDKEREGIRVSGCGMDMGFHVVYELGWKLFGDGWPCSGERCPSPDHTSSKCTCGHAIHDHAHEGWKVNGCEQKDCSCRKYRHQDAPRGAGVTHRDGYSLKHEWL